jgi:hypothetical protein
VVNGWDVNSRTFKANSKAVVLPTPSPTPTPEPQLSSSPSPDPTPTPTIKPEAVAKKKTITCIKGKVKKKITAVNPKCPKGYKRA